MELNLNPEGITLVPKSLENYFKAFTFMSKLEFDLQDVNSIVLASVISKLIEPHIEQLNEPAKFH